MTESIFGTEKIVIKGVEWDWKNFKSTKGFPVSEELLEWVIGQDKALEECYLCLDEWVHKLKWVQDEDWYKVWEDPNNVKPNIKRAIPSGPSLLLLGDAGTGKSLIGRALAEKLTELYKKNGIILRDVLCWRNNDIPSEPKISTHKFGEGKKIVRMSNVKGGKERSFWSKFIIFMKYFLLTIGILFMVVGGYLLWNSYLTWLNSTILQDMYGLMEYMMLKFIEIGSMTFLPAGIMLIFLVLILVLGRMGGGMGGGGFGVGGAMQTNAPKLIVDNSQQVAPFIDATGHKSAQLFGSIAWDPLQTGGMGTPEHQRTSAGDVHKANLGILYIDEIKNLHPEEGVTILTVLEEGQLPITLRSRWASGGTAAMAVSTEPVPCLTFLVGAGNFDSIPQIHPALMDRIYGYGKVVRMNNDMPNTIDNRRKYIQFIAQEVKRFRFPPFSREACEEIVAEGRRRSGKRNRLTTKFRPLISLIKTASTLAINEYSKGTNPNKIKIMKWNEIKKEWKYSETFVNKDNSICEELVERKHVREAIEEHCKTIETQLLEYQVEEHGEFLEINPTGEEIGNIYGMAVLVDSFSKEMTGSVLQVKGSMEEKSALQKKFKGTEGYLEVTGISSACEHGSASWMQDSIAKVRMVIIQKYGIDIAQHYFTHIDFAQSHGVDGSSAGVTMTLLLCSLIDKKKIRQDVAVTGEINLAIDGKVKITAIGGTHEKIKAAEAWGFKKVVIPKRNLEKSIDPKDYKIEIVGAETLDEYLKEVLVE